MNWTGNGRTTSMRVTRRHLSTSSLRLRQVSAWIPGFIAGAADLDPTTVVAIAVVGATTIYGLSWVVLLIFPLLAVVQVIASRLALVTGRDLQSAALAFYGRPAQVALLISLLTVNVFTLTADLEGGAAALGLLAGVGWRWFVLPLAVVAGALLVLGVYGTVEKFLLYALACLGAYVVAAFLAHPDWGHVIVATFIPSLRFDSNWIGGALAILGTTLTAYVYVWLSIEESEKAAGPSLKEARSTGAWGGVLMSVIIAWFILVATGATLGTHHRQVVTVEDAAQALRPIAGPLAADFFGVGLLASTLVALPVIAATSGYVLGAQFGWRRGLSVPVTDAPWFYAAIALTIAAAVILTFCGLSPVRVLYVASIAGGLATPIGLVLLVSATSRRDVMGEYVVTGRLRLAGWIVTGLLTVLGLVYLIQQAAS